MLFFKELSLKKDRKQNMCSCIIPCLCHVIVVWNTIHECIRRFGREVSAALHDLKKNGRFGRKSHKVVCA